jgi:1,4-alpha-glucan branching enzyme
MDKNTQADKSRKTMFSLTDSKAKQVYITGEFNHWTKHPMRKIGKKLWEAQIDLKLGKYEYLFIVDGQYTKDPNCQMFKESPYGTQNCLKIV